MKRILPLLCDAGLGMIVILLVSASYGRYEYTALWFLIFAFLPDLDASFEIMKKRYVASSARNPHDHREGLHYPILWLGYAGLAWLVFGFYGCLAFFLLMFHFIHDSVLTGWGIAWFAPFSRKSFKFFVNEQNELSLARKDWVRTWNEQELRKAIVKNGQEDWIDRLYLKLTPVSIIEYAVFIVSTVALAIFMANIHLAT